MQEHASKRTSEGALRCSTVLQLFRRRHIHQAGCVTLDYHTFTGPTFTLNCMEIRKEWKAHKKEEENNARKQEKGRQRGHKVLSTGRHLKDRHSRLGLVVE